MTFGVIGEGITDFKVVKNLLIGFFNNKNLQVNQLYPEQTQPGGWSNVLAYLQSEKFSQSLMFNDYVIVQIDTKECEEWKAEINNIGDKEELLEDFINKVEQFLISKIDTNVYSEYKRNIIFAITIHEIECWLLPFISEKKAEHKKLVTCSKTVERIANKIGISINQKNYADGKHYDDFSSEMKKQKELLAKSELNPSLKVFMDKLQKTFPKEN